MSENVQSEIAKVNKKFVDSFNNDDFAGLKSVYTDNAKVIPPGFDTIEGKEGIAAFWKGGKEQMGIKQVALNTVEVQADGDIAYELGRYVLTGDAGELDNGKYVVVWKKDSDGQWKWHWDIWNSNKG